VAIKKVLMVKPEINPENKPRSKDNSPQSLSSTSSFPLLEYHPVKFLRNYRLAPLIFFHGDDVHPS
jgi:hypothetical protein